jgi:hypothetical protein
MGGTYDPATKQIVWKMNVPLEEQRTFYRSHPPQALGALRSTAVDLDWRFDGHGEPINSVFSLACPCGGGRFTATCGVDGDNNVAPPIGLECSDCEEIFEIFNVGAQVDDPEHFDDLTPEGFAAPHEVIVRFEHASETLGDPRLVGREPDAFCWFTLLARAPGDGRLEQLFDWECA